jgi:GDP-fucose transporter C1
MLVNGDVIQVFNFERLYSPAFWLMMTLSGVFGFLMSYVTGLQIQVKATFFGTMFTYYFQVTSALTHNISGTAKAAAQTVLAVTYWQEIKPALWWLSNGVVLFGSAAYTYVKQREIVNNFEKTSAQRASTVPANVEKSALLDDSSSDVEQA